MGREGLTIRHATAVEPVVDAVVANFATEAIDDAVATFGWEIVASKATAFIGTVVDAVITDFAQGRRDDSVSAEGKRTFRRTHIIVREVSIIAFFTGHAVEDAVAAAGDNTCLEAV